MHLKKKLLLPFLTLLIFSGCGGSTQTTQSLSNLNDDIPDWYLHKPTDPNYIYESASAVSKDLELSVSKASTDARAKVGQAIEIKLNNMQKKFDEEVGTGDNANLLQQFTQATKTVVSTVLSGSNVAKKEIKKEGLGFRAYVLVEYPIGAAAQAFQKQLSQRQELYTRFRASESFKELDEEVKKYEEWKKNH